MSASMILVLLVVAAISARIMRSTKMWWIFLFTIMTGLLVGMLSKEAVNHFAKKEVMASIAPTNTVDNVDLLCMLPVVTVTEGATHGVTGYTIDLVEPLSDALVGNHTTKGRDSPEFEDDS
ncbi:hypothetical protein [uncultured phage cr52_1]|jgi:hypothetical protein|uniref:Uncharacterized protein n=1 Tax=uncultured phage cr52_1 TaxID=2772079 RepID=A0A7M1RQG4_9CAUD|nr:hypothetical protein KNV46_gp55 [uncultured phage cr52_1]QOR56675.1 hypothetical protein [uncultured phage cr52_1]